MATRTGSAHDTMTTASAVAVPPPTRASTPTPDVRARDLPTPRRTRADTGGIVRALLGVSTEGSASPFTFFAALRRLECHFRRFPRWGEAVRPADEPVRFGQDPSLAFRPTALTSVHDDTADGPPRLMVGFLGMFGPFGPLPSHLTEYAYERQRHHGDRGFARFFDIFHHRILTLLYRAWASGQPTVSHDRPDDDWFARRLAALVGVSTGTGTTPLTDLDYACLHSAVHFVPQTRHAEGLAKVLQESLGVDVVVEEFVGRWLEIPSDLCWRLPSDATAKGASIGVLGESTTVGRQVWDQQSTFGLTVGPLSRERYEGFLPGGQDLKRLLALVQRYAGPELDWTVRLVLREPERQGAVLGAVGIVGLTAHLGGGDGGALGALPFEDLVIDPSQLAP